MYYIDSGRGGGYHMGEAIVCPKCANSKYWSGKQIVDCEINYEDSALYCENCNARIPSAYAEDDAI